MKATIVPGRNTLMLASALSFAEGMFPNQRVNIYYGAHAGDHAIYPDCRPEYIQAMTQTVRLASEGKVSLLVPWQGMTKGEILGVGIKLQERGNVMDYGDTYTCYEGGEHPCGKCGACVERAEAFALHNLPDPLVSAASA